MSRQPQGRSSWESCTTDSATQKNKLIINIFKEDRYIHSPRTVNFGPGTRFWEDYNFCDTGTGSLATAFFFALPLFALRSRGDV